MAQKKSAGSPLILDTNVQLCEFSTHSHNDGGMSTFPRAPNPPFEAAAHLDPDAGGAGGHEALPRHDARGAERRQLRLPQLLLHLLVLLLQLGHVAPGGGRGRGTGRRWRMKNGNLPARTATRSKSRLQSNIGVHICTPSPGLIPMVFDPLGCWAQLGSKSWGGYSQFGRARYNSDSIRPKTGDQGGKVAPETDWRGVLLERGNHILSWV